MRSYKGFIRQEWPVKADRPKIDVDNDGERCFFQCDTQHTKRVMELFKRAYGS